MRSIPWRKIVRLAVLGTLVMTTGVLIDLDAKGGHVVNLIQPGADGPSAEAFAEDFPDLELPRGLGHDGQQFYVIARAPMHPDEVSEQLDRPRYRYQRPLFPALGWLLHPSGGGSGLVAALFVVGVVALLAAGIGAGTLSSALGGGTWPALLVPLLPGSYAALRLTLADTLALGLALLALLWAERRRAGPAAVCAVLAVLAKESILVVLVGHAVFRRTRSSVLAAGAATAAAAMWWAVVRVVVEAHSAQVLEFTWPFGGVVRSADDWLGGKEWIAGVAVVTGFALAFLALARRGPRHPLVGALAAATAFSVFLGPDVLGLDFNGPRTLGPVIVLAILTMGTPTPGMAVASSPPAGTATPASNVPSGR